MCLCRLFSGKTALTPEIEHHMTDMSVSKPTAIDHHPRGHQPDLSVVVLGYQAGHGLKRFVRELIRFLDGATIDYQIVLVGNYWPGTGDLTPEIAEALARSHPRITTVTRAKKKGGMGWDLKTGLALASGRCIAFIDGDGQMPAYDVVRVYKKIRENRFDLVKTYREKRFDEAWRTFISYSYNLLFKILFPGLEATDINSKPKIFTQAFLKEITLTSDDWFVDAEIMIQARRLGVRMAQIPTVFRRNEKRASFVKFAAIFEFIKNLTIYRLREFRN